jgi:thioredoxin-like negative regulator of GroEL
VSPQILALTVVGIVVLAAVALESWRARRARREALLSTAGSSSEPYILYFTGEGCTVCKTHQEPALARLGGVRVDRVDAIAEPELSERFRVYTLPTTIVMAPDGRAVHVNYGYAPAPKLEKQLAELRLNLRSAATA